MEIIYNGQVMGTFTGTGFGGQFLAELVREAITSKNAKPSEHCSVDYNEHMGRININTAAYGTETITLNGEAW